MTNPWDPDRPIDADEARALAGYRKIDGELADAANVPGGFADRFAAFLSALHATPREAVAAAGAPVEGAWTPAAARAEQRHEFAATQDALDPALRDACRRHLDADPPPPYAGPPRLTHNDIFPEHIVVDGKGIAGVLDWGDACLGDPAADFGCAGFLGGDALLDAVLARYRGDVDPARARYGARGIAVGYVLYGARRPDARYLERGRFALVRLGLLAE